MRIGVCGSETAQGEASETSGALGTPAHAVHERRRPSMVLEGLKGLGSRLVRSVGLASQSENARRRGHAHVAAMSDKPTPSTTVAQRPMPKTKHGLAILTGQQRPESKMASPAVFPETGEMSTSGKLSAVRGPGLNALKGQLAGDALVELRFARESNHVDGADAEPETLLVPLNDIGFGAGLVAHAPSLRGEDLPEVTRRDAGNEDILPPQADAAHAESLSFGTHQAASRLPDTAEWDPRSGRSKIESELAALRSAPRQADSRALTESERQIAGYVLAREVDGRPVGDDLPRLKSANESVAKAREMLRYGRGNVQRDIDASEGESIARVAVGRAINRVRGGDGTTNATDEAALAILTEAGNCGEHANVAVHLHAGKLRARGDEVRLVARRGIDHAWGEADNGARTSEQTIVLDPWNHGSAVYAADSRHGQSSLGLQQHARFTGKDGLRVLSRMEGIVDDLRQQFDQQFPELLEHARKTTAGGKGAYRTTKPVINSSFAERASKNLSKPLSASEAIARGTGQHRSVLSRAKARLTQSSATRKAEAAHADMRSTVKAIGVLRSLGIAGDLASTVQQASDVVIAAKNLTEAAPPRAQSPAPRRRSTKSDFQGAAPSGSRPNRGEGTGQ